MENVIDKLVADLTVLASTDEADGGLEGVIDVKDVKWDDPGYVITDEYPYIFVSPLSDEPDIETMGRPGYDVRSLLINVGIVINQADYFDPTTSTASGSRELVVAAGVVRRHFRRLDKRSLDHEAGKVRNLRVVSISYLPEIRGDAFARMAVISLVVDKQYQNQQ